MEAEPRLVAPNRAVSTKGRGRADPPLAAHMRPREFLNRTYDGKAIRRSKACRGKKTRKAGGFHRSLYHDFNKVDPREFQGAYNSPPKLEFTPEVEKLPRKPISAPARKLLKEYFRRRCFWELVERDGYSVRFAGETILGVEVRSSQLIHKELTGAGGPWLWFAWAAALGIRTGDIAPGRATAGSEDADLFFNALAGSPGHVADIETRAFGGRSVALVGGPYEGISGVEIDVLEYLKCRLLKNTSTRRRG